MKRLLLSLILILSAAAPAVSQDWALKGFDPVGYIAQGQALPGKPEIVTQWHGVSWHFANEENRLLFEANPRAYIPGFDGFCPVSLAEGRRERGDPREFVVIGQRLYLLRSADEARQLMAAPRDILNRARQTWAAGGN